MLSSSSNDARVCGLGVCYPLSRAEHVQRTGILVVVGGWLSCGVTLPRESVTVMTLAVCA